MKKTDDYKDRAAEFLKQWQLQMTRQMHDPDVIRTLLAAMQSFGAPAHDETARKPAAAADAAGDAIRKLEQRLDAVERELARILPLVAKTKDTARTGRRSAAKPVAANKRPVAKGKRATAAKPKPAARTKRKPK